VAGAGNGFTVGILRHSQRKRGATDRLDLRNTAPVLDPTGKCHGFLLHLPELVFDRIEVPSGCRPFQVPLRSKPVGFILGDLDQRKEAERD
jgi:hypothetical protein